MKWTFSILCFAFPLFADMAVPSKASVFSLTPEEMVFASKLSDSNRRRFCYQFSIKERHLAMAINDSNLSEDTRVEEVFSSFRLPLETKTDTR
jgi:hypothetical protein